MFGTSRQPGDVLEDWKKEIVTIFKKSKEDLGNYTPVHLSSNPGKVTEPVTWKPFPNMQNKRVIVNSQCKITKGKSCLTSLIAFFH